MPVTVLLLGLLSIFAQSAPHCDAGQSPRFAARFALLAAQTGEVMGEPLSCPYADPGGSGDTLQDTSTGLAVWRHAINVPTFTDGWTHWALINIGLARWTGTGTTDTLVYVPGLPAIEPASVSIDLGDLSITTDQAAQFVLAYPGTAFASGPFEVDATFCAASSTLQPWIGPFSGRPDNAPICVVQLRGQFDTHRTAPGSHTNSIRGDFAHVVFDGHTGNLLGSGCCAPLPAELIPD